MFQNHLKNNHPYLCYEPSPTTEYKNFNPMSWNILRNFEFYQKKIEIRYCLRFHTHNMFREYMTVSLQFRIPHL